MSRKFDFSAYRLPLGTEFVLGKRRWRLVDKMKEHPDHLTFAEVSPCPNTPPRVFNPSEIDALFALGIEFVVPMNSNNCEVRKP